MKYIKTALVLAMIAAVCSLLIAFVNLFTSEAIIKNKQEKKENLCKEIFADYDGETSNIVVDGFESKYILEKIEAKDSSGNVLGYIYTVKGANAYGNIELLVGINADKTLKSVKFMSNGQSFNKETSDYVDAYYVGGLDSDSVEGLDVKCGATYAAKLVKELVGAAFADCLGVQSNG